MSGQAAPLAAAPGGGARVTVPVSLAPDEAARNLAPRLRALAGEGTPASSIDRRADSVGAPDARAPLAVPVVTIDGYSRSCMAQRCQCGA